MNIQALSYINVSDIIDQYSELNKIDWSDVVNISYGAVDFTLITMTDFVNLLAVLYERDQLSEETYATLSYTFDSMSNVYVNLENVIID